MQSTPTLTDPADAPPVSASAGPLAPTGAAERIHLLDILRGFALLGILLVNMPLFANPIYYAVVAPPPGSPLDAAIDWFIRFAGEGKFYSLFSFLFGLGFTIIMTRARARGLAFVPLQMRRLLVLLVFGLAHALLIWVGDILTFYAVLGFVLLLFRNTSPKWLLRWAIIMLLLPVLFLTLSVVSLEFARTTPEGAAMMNEILMEQTNAFTAMVQQAYIVYAEGNFLEITAQRWNDVLVMWGIGLFIAPNILAMFLLGAWFGKREIFRDPSAHVALFRRLLIWGGLVGVVGNAIYAQYMATSNRIMPDLNFLIASLAQNFGAPALMLAYVAAFALLAQSASWGSRLMLLAPVGRMALTNYLLQSIICTLIFNGYGLGLFGQINATTGLILTVVIYLAQIPFSHWWMRRYRFGPAEWLWRTLTYGKLQPMRADT